MIHGFTANNVNTYMLENVMIFHNKGREHSPSFLLGAQKQPGERGVEEGVLLLQ